MSFIKISEKKTIKDIIIQEFEHEKTGARHTHFVVEGGEKAFNISFKTPVEDRKGLPHIIEHLILNGSKNYPVDNMFLKLSDRNFETMLNASTSNNFTTFYYSSNVEEGYLNLSEVFLDAVLNPLLTEKGFLTEGFRYELDEEQNLKFSGVVYNEMMGWVGKTRGEHIFRTALGPHSENEFAGGDPISIADVKHQDILDFHEKYYRPSNAHVVTTGDVDVEKIHNKLDKYFDKFEKTQRVVFEPFNLTERKEYYQVNHTGNDVISTFLMSPLGVFEENRFKDLVILNNLLANDLNVYFQEKHPSLNYQGTQIFKHGNQMFTLTSFDLQTKEHIEKLKEYVNDAYVHLSKTSITEEIFDTFFNNALANIKSELKTSYANKINTEAVMNINKGFSCDFNLISAKEMLSQRAFFEQKGVISNMISDNFVGTKTITVSSIPDPDFIEKYNEKIKQKEIEINSVFTQDEKFAIAEKINTLPSLEGNSESLPKVNIDKTFKANKLNANGITNNISSVNGGKVNVVNLDNGSDDAVVKLKYNFIPSNEEEICFEIIALHLMEHSNNKGMDKQQTSVWRNQNIKSSNITIAEEHNKVNNLTSIFLLSQISGQKQNILELIEKASALQTIQEVKEQREFKEILEKIIQGFESASGNILYKYALTYAKKNMRNNLFDYYDEAKVLRKIKEMIQSLSDNDATYFNKFNEYYNSDKRNNNNVFEAEIQCDPKDNTSVLTLLKEKNIMGEQNRVSSVDLEKLITIDEKQKNTLLVADTSSAFVSLSYDNPYGVHDVKEQMLLNLTATVINTKLKDKLRVEQGVYSTFVMRDNDTVSLFAYRTPDSLETLDVMKNVFNEILIEGIDDAIFEDIKRKELTAFTKYTSKSEILALMNRQRALLVNEERELQVNTILNVKKEDLLDMIKMHFLNNENYSVCIADNSSILERDKINKEEFDIVMYPSQEIVTKKQSNKKKP